MARKRKRRDVRREVRRARALDENFGTVILPDVKEEKAVVELTVCDSTKERCASCGKLPENEDETFIGVNSARLYCSEDCAAECLDTEEFLIDDEDGFVPDGEGGADGYAI